MARRWKVRVVAAVLGAALAAGLLPGVSAAVEPAGTARAAEPQVAPGPGERCYGNLTVYGARTDRRLTYSVIDPDTGAHLRTTVSTKRVGFDPRAWAVLDTRTLLVTERGTGALWRIDVTGTAPFTYVRTRLAASGWTYAHLAYDGAGHLYGLDSGRLVRWTVSVRKPRVGQLTGRQVVGWIGSMRTLAASGRDHLYATTPTGRLVELTVGAAGQIGRTDVVTRGWDAKRHVVTPGGGIVYAVAAQGRRMSWHLRTASGFAEQDGLVGGAWKQTRLAAAQSVCVTTLPVETDCAKVTVSTPTQYTVVASGFRVHPCVAQRVDDMVAAAKQQGIALGGWGWRDTATQIRLRKQNCGTTQYAIWEMPSSQCQPPTAIPGTSMHERGLALDLTANGSSVTSSSAAFAWLTANAARYGFRNLPSEPWHWSTTGG